MNDIPPSEAILFPADGRTPHLVDLMSSILTTPDPMTGQLYQQRIPYPQVHMNYIATNTTHRVWESRVSCLWFATSFPSSCLFVQGYSQYIIRQVDIGYYDLMKALTIQRFVPKRNFQYPYVVFFPILSQSGAPFPINLNIRDIQGRAFREPGISSTIMIII